MSNGKKEMFTKLSLSWIESFFEEACESFRGNLDVSELSECRVSGVFEGAQV